MISGGRWRNDAPPTDTPVEVWWVNTIILARYDGKAFHTLDGDALPGVAYWRKRANAW